MKYRKEAFDRWGPHLPRKVIMLKTVYPDIPRFVDRPLLVCKKFETYQVMVNQYGAVTAVGRDGGTLGLKPSEFKVVSRFDPRRNEKEDTGNADS